MIHPRMLRTRRAPLLLRASMLLLYMRPNARHCRHCPAAATVATAPATANATATAATTPGTTPTASRPRSLTASPPWPRLLRRVRAQSLRRRFFSFLCFLRLRFSFLCFLCFFFSLAPLLLWCLRLRSRRSSSSSESLERSLESDGSLAGGSSSSSCSLGPAALPLLSVASSSLSDPRKLRHWKLRCPTLPHLLQAPRLSSVCRLPERRASCRKFLKFSCFCPALATASLVFSFSFSEA
mmetsp:Transcript_10654/g.39104  ORF Transcript_10654/g.39104 Transcript_10654/m.39104 type:complete len:239 (-) Transcript_10654:249-965(-)